MSKFSNFKIYPIRNPAGSLVGNGSCVYDNVVELRFTVVKGSKGLFVSLPQEKGKDKETGADKWFPKVRILDEAMRNEFQQLAVNEYSKTVQGGGKPAGAPTGRPGAGPRRPTAPQPPAAPDYGDEDAPF